MYSHICNHGAAQWSFLFPTRCVLRMLPQPAALPHLLTWMATAHLPRSAATRPTRGVLGQRHRQNGPRSQRWCLQWLPSFSRRLKMHRRGVQVCSTNRVRSCGTSRVPAWHTSRAPAWCTSRAPPCATSPAPAWCIIPAPASFINRAQSSSTQRRGAVLPLLRQQGHRSRNDGPWPAHQAPLLHCNPRFRLRCNRIRQWPRVRPLLAFNGRQLLY